MMRAELFLAIGLATLAGCSTAPAPEASAAGAVFGVSAKGTSAADATAFLAEAEAKLDQVSLEAAKASWIQATYITDDTEYVAAKASERAINLSVHLAKEAAKFDKTGLPAEQARKMKLLKLGLTLATPADPKESEEATMIAAKLEGIYGKGKYCKDPAKADTCLDIGGVEKIFSNSRDPKELQDAWTGWHKVSPVMKKDYARLVELSNKGARELGFADTGVMWRSGYDMPAEDLPKELDRLWNQVKPLYDSLHAYARMKLRERYPDAVAADKPIPAHLLGNIWAQDWSHVYPLLAPRDADPGYDLDKILTARKTTPVQMVKYGESFFTSLGFPALPQTFWERSMITKPADREVVCHASAWDLDNVDDLRIKMCISPTGEDFSTIHHELGHNFYQRAYNKQPILFRGSANDGFHEAIGDTIALSITPEYLVKLGFLGKPTDSSKDIGLLMQRALEKVAFLPFGLLIDQWRWKVFSGEVKPGDYNAAWWQLRTKYQGIAPGLARTEADFDPGAKYHVPANVPYTRYFLAHILQFQFHRALAKEAGCTGPLHRCSVYQSKAAGAKLNKMLEMGLSKPWPEALEAVTGSRQMDATAIVDYFAPLKEWMDKQTANAPKGW
jgi:peptidyl-dipeptidase A